MLTCTCKLSLLRERSDYKLNLIRWAQLCQPLHIQANNQFMPMLSCLQTRAPASAPLSAANRLPSCTTAQCPYYTVHTSHGQKGPAAFCSRCIQNPSRLLPPSVKTFQNSKLAPRCTLHATPMQRGAPHDLRSKGPLLHRRNDARRTWWLQNSRYIKRTTHCLCHTVSSSPPGSVVCSSAPCST